MDDPRLGLEAVATAAYLELGAAINGAGVDTGRAFSAFETARAQADAAASTTADIISKLNDPETADLAIKFMPAAEKAARIADAQSVYDTVSKVAAQNMDAALDVLESVLSAAAMSDLARDTDAGARLLTRQDIDAALVGIKGTIFPVLLSLAQSSPEIAKELASGYGAAKLKANGEGAMVSRLLPTLMAALPGATPKAQAARRALATLAKTRGAMTGTIHAGRAKVEAASARRINPHAFRPDTIRPIR